MIPTLPEIAWAAGIFEGEGNIYSYDSRRRPLERRGRGIEVRLSVTSTDEDVVRRFHEIVDCGTVRGPQMYGHSSGSRKPYWRWEVGAQEDVRRIAALFDDWMCARRHNRFREVIAALDELPPKRTGRKRVAL